MDSEKEFHENKAQKRSEIFKGIIFDEVGGTSLNDVMVSLGIRAMQITVLEHKDSQVQ